MNVHLNALTNIVTDAMNTPMMIVTAFAYKEIYFARALLLAIHAKNVNINIT